ncbi:MAG: alpha/beta hydrolase, partial [Actinobacteria bacterium]|nr:alpha/beta hydrolase [Actinomycetota bacterium]MBU1943980.1 alpha/beta hydrolase [Actinomycetota bacterium]MBU2688476.1 alpha/beta hydrolase [Actinomycetota bacterium]
HPRASKQRVNVDDINVFFRRFGSGDPVLLLHGGFMFAETWAGQIPALSRDHLLIAPDARGHGRTTLGDETMTYRRLADDAAELVERLDLGPVHVVGWSDGGCAALGMAIKHPDVLRSISLLGTTWNFDNYSDETVRKMTSITDPHSPVATAMVMLRRFLTPEPYKGVEFLRAVRHMWLDTLDFTLEELGGITTPTLIIATDRDEFLCAPDDPTRLFKEMAEAIPGAVMAEIPGGTHLVNLMQPHAVNRVILDYWASVR